MTINFFLQSKDFGGAEKFAHDLVLELARKKITINFYTTNSFLIESLNGKNYIKVEKIPVYLDFAGNGRGLIKSLLLLPTAKIYYLRTLLKIMKNPDKQVIICSGFSEKIVVTPLAKFLNLSVFFIEYGPLEPIFKKFFGLPKLLYFLSKNFTKKVIVPSANTRRHLSKIFSREKMVLIPCGSPIPKIKGVVKIKNSSIAVVSRLERGKGQDLAIKAFKLVQKEVSNAQLLIVGKGDSNYEQELKKISVNNKQIKFLNFLEDKQKLVEESEIILCPSVWPLEGFGLTIIEAMALGKPIVAFNRNPGNELIDDRCALLAKDGDFINLAKQIIKLIKDKSLQEKLGKQAKEKFLKNYQIQKIAQQYLALLQN
jgi:glycosyltransferase involved in cell wall biosynthesis